ncbi:glucose 1-dehydrogenase [Brevibacterium samyangense]|uniref:SDR family NAD(P)-dependent oxidoreductase n=1 Tax=Brevibacterium samyangense TaxID=366888 RepID=A0ABP5ESJ1_9MICO
MTTCAGRFDGRNIIVTGAGSGIGRASALRFAAEGGKVAVVDIKEEAAAETVSLITEAGGTAISVVGDLADRTVTEIVAATTLEAFGGIDVLVNNAGVNDRFEAVHELEEDMFERVMRVNVNSVYLLSKAVLPHMLEKGSGAIVNTASEAGLRGSASGAAYTASKHAVVGLTKSMAVMYRAAGIRVNAIAPGGVATNIMDGIEMTMNHGLTQIGPFQQTMVGRVATSESLAAAITFAASDDASNISGAILPVDNGWSAI